MANSSHPDASRTFLELLFDAMKTTGIKSIACTFSGAADSGDTDIPEYNYKRLRRRKNGPPIPSNDARKSECFKAVSSGLLLLGADDYSGASSLDALITMFFDRHISPNAGNWYDNTGGQGSFTFDLAERRVSWECSYNTEEEVTRDEISIALDAPTRSSISRLRKWLPKKFPALPFFRQLLNICAETGTINSVNTTFTTDSDWGHILRTDKTYERAGSQEASCLPEAAVRQLIRDHGFEDQSDGLVDVRLGYPLLHGFMVARFIDTCSEHLDEDDRESVTLVLDVLARTLRLERNATVWRVCDDSDSGEITLDDEDDDEIANAA